MKKLLSVLVAIALFANVVYADTAGAFVRSGEPIEVNSKLSSTEVHAIPGDRVSVTAAAQLMSPGVEVIMRGGSNLQLAPNGIQFSRGAAKVNLAEGKEISFYGLKAVSQKGTSQVLLVAENNELHLAANRGGLVISDGVSSLNLPEGRELSYRMDVALTSPPTAAAQGAPVPPVFASGGVFGGLSAWTIGIIAGVSIAATVGTLYATGVIGGSASPSR